LDAVNVCRAVKDYSVDIPVVMGGAHTKIFPKETVELPSVDYVCEGDGEKTIVLMVQALLKGKSLKGIPNLWTKEGGQGIPPTQLVPAYTEADEAETPELGLIDLNKYSHPFLFNGPGLIPIATGRGCPYRCTFCNSAGKKPLLKTPSKIAEEIVRGVKTSGVKNVFLIDDTFNLSVKRFKDVCEEILKADIGIHWAFRGRVDKMDDETLALAKKSGLRHISFGVEDVTDEGLRAVKKGIEISDVLRAFELCKKHKIHASANFIVGLPHNQGVETAARLRAFIAKLAPTTVQISVLMLVPGSEIFEQALAKNVITDHEWRNYAKNPGAIFFLPGWEERTTLEEQFKICTEVLRGFYFTPIYILRRLVAIRSFSEFATNVKIGLRLLRFGEKPANEK